ncbi:MAG: hypothetical protein IJM54_07000 [Thermoguttaceae bacterium]|nr:hypothetical protein [Thermoguttaceae bacterium]
MKRLAILSLALLVACSIVVSGCQKKRVKGLVPAQGVVTLNGEKVAGATVLFSPKEIGGQTGSAQAITDDKGVFKMTTLDPGDGVYPGEYSVSIIKDKIEGGLSPEEAKERYDNPDKYRGQPLPEQTVVHEIPVKYADINESGLTITVPAGGQKDIEFALEGEVDLTPQTLGAGHGGGR